eukprot:bmy_02492T0
MGSLLTPAGPHKNGPWAWHTSLPTDGILTAYAGLVTLSVIIFPYFRLNVYYFVLLKYMCHMAPGQPQCLSVPFGERTRFFCCTRRVCVGQLPCVGFWEGPAGYRKLTFTTEAHLSLSLPYSSKALFQPVLNCIVFSVATPIPRCSGQKCFRLLLLIIGNKCHLLDKTLPKIKYMAMVFGARKAGRKCYFNCPT